MVLQGIGSQTPQSIVALSAIGTVIGLTIFYALVRFKNWTVSFAKRGSQRAIQWYYNDTDIGKSQKEVYETHGRLAEVGLIVAFPGFIVPIFVFGLPDMMYSMVVGTEPVPSIVAIKASAYTFMIGLAITALGVIKSEYPNFESLQSG